MTSWVRGLLASLGFVLVCLLIWSNYGQHLNPERLPTPIDSVDRLEREGAPDFGLPDLLGKQVQLSSFKGKIIVLNFWATWCAPCVTEFPSLLKMAGQMRENVVLVTVAGDERKGDVLAFINTFKGYAKNVVHLYDPSGETAKLFGTEKLPETYIFNKDMKLVKKVVSSIEWDEPEVLSFLKSL